MKWHSNRKQNSRAARERFLQAGEAYKIPFEKAPKENYGRAETSRSGENRTNSDQESARHEGHRTGSNGGHDEFADTVFRGAMLDYAIKLEALLRQLNNGQAPGGLVSARGGWPDAATLTRLLADFAASDSLVSNLVTLLGQIKESSQPSSQ